MSFSDMGDGRSILRPRGYLTLLPRAVEAAYRASDPPKGHTGDTPRIPGEDWTRVLVTAREALAEIEALLEKGAQHPKGVVIVVPFSTACKVREAAAGFAAEGR